MARLPGSSTSTLPVFAIWCWASLGIYVQSLGLPVWLPPLMGTVVYGGWLEFVLASLLLGSFAPVSAFLMALIIQARRIFYGLTMLSATAATACAAPLLICAMTTRPSPSPAGRSPSEGVDKGWSPPTHTHTHDTSRRQRAHTQPLQHHKEIRERKSKGEVSISQNDEEHVTIKTSQQQQTPTPLTVEVEGGEHDRNHLNARSSTKQPYEADITGSKATVRQTHTPLAMFAAVKCQRRSRSLQ